MDNAKQLATKSVDWMKEHPGTTCVIVCGAAGVATIFSSYWFTAGKKNPIKVVPGKNKKVVKKSSEIAKKHEDIPKSPTVGSVVGAGDTDYVVFSSGLTRLEKGLDKLKNRFENLGDIDESKLVDEDEKQALQFLRTHTAQTDMSKAELNNQQLGTLYMQWFEQNAASESFNCHGDTSEGPAIPAPALEKKASVIISVDKALSVQRSLASCVS
jgi:hypothetical protein